MPRPARCSSGDCRGRIAIMHIPTVTTVMLLSLLLTFLFCLSPVLSSPSSHTPSSLTNIARLAALERLLDDDSFSPPSASSLQADTDSIDSSPSLLQTHSHLHLHSLNLERVISRRVRKEDQQRAREMMQMNDAGELSETEVETERTANTFAQMSEEEQRLAVEHSFNEVFSAVEEARPISSAASPLLLQTSEAPKSATSYWKNGHARRWWCSSVRFGYAWIESTQQWKDMCAGIEKFRPWGWWSQFCHAIHEGEWGAWYREDKWWKKQCHSIVNPHYIKEKEKRQWIWDPRHRRNAQAGWCEQHGHKYRDLTSPLYNHYCYGREAPLGYVRGLWDVDPAATETENENYWTCRAYRRYDDAWKTKSAKEDSTSEYAKKCTKGEGARGAKHPGFKPEMTLEEKKAILQKAEEKAKKVYEKLSAPSWRWSPSIPKQNDTKWCEKNGLTEASSVRFLTKCDGNQETPEEKEKRIRRKVKWVKRRILYRIPHNEKEQGYLPRLEVRLERLQKKIREMEDKLSTSKDGGEKKSLTKHLTYNKQRLEKLKLKIELARLSLDDLVLRRKDTKEQLEVMKKSQKGGQKASDSSSSSSTAAADKSELTRLKKELKRIRKAIAYKLSETKWRKEEEVEQYPLAKEYVSSSLIRNAKREKKNRKIYSEYSDIDSKSVWEKFEAAKKDLLASLPKDTKQDIIDSMVEALKVAAFMPGREKETEAAANTKSAVKEKDDPSLQPPAQVDLPAVPTTAPGLDELSKVQEKQQEIEQAKSTWEMEKKKGEKANAAANAQAQQAGAIPGAPAGAAAFGAQPQGQQQPNGMIAAFGAQPQGQQPNGMIAAFGAQPQGAQGLASPLTAGGVPGAPGMPGVGVPGAPGMPGAQPLSGPPGFNGAPLSPLASEEAQRLAARRARWAAEDEEEKQSLEKRRLHRKYREAAERRADAEEAALRDARKAGLAGSGASGSAAGATGAGVKGESKDWNANKYPNPPLYTPPSAIPPPVTLAVPQVGADGCPTCKKVGMKKSWEIVLDPTTTNPADLPLIEELHRRVDYLLDDPEKTKKMSVKESDLRAARKQAVDAEEHHIRIQDFGIAHKDQLLIPEYIQDEQKEVQL